MAFLILERKRLQKNLWLAQPEDTDGITTSALAKNLEVFIYIYVFLSRFICCIAAINPEQTAH